MRLLFVGIMALTLLAGCGNEAANVENDPAGTTTGPGENSPEATAAFENYGSEDK